MGLYTPLSVPTAPWEDIRMDFMLGFPKTHQLNEPIFVVVNKFSKITHSIPCRKTSDAVGIVVLFFKEIVRLHEFPKSTRPKKYTNFMGHFWITL